MPYFTVYKTDREILDAVSDIYLEGKWFAYDPTFSKGIIYAGKLPKIKSDLKHNAHIDFIADCTNLSCRADSYESIVFDPPFIVKKMTKDNKSPHKVLHRFGHFDTYADIEKMYQLSLHEFHRVLKKKGILAFKCQDYTDQHIYPSHIKVFEFALQAGFKLEDIFIKHNTSKRYNPALTQRHAYKTHCYYLIFQKKRKGRHVQRRDKII